MNDHKSCSKDRQITMDTVLNWFVHFPRSDGRYIRTVIPDEINRMISVLDAIEKGPKTGVSYMETLAPMYCDSINPRTCVLYSHLKGLNDLDLISMSERVDESMIKRSDDLPGLVMVMEPHSDHYAADMYVHIKNQEGINEFKEKLNNLMNNKDDNL
jgi:hypothetical protein